MAHTDKDRPHWVQNAEHGHIDHDHRTGKCIIDDDQRNRWGAWNHHWRDCKKRVRVPYTCTKDDPNRTWRDGQTCWTWLRECDCPIPEDWKREPHGCLGRLRRITCVGHTRIEIDDSIPCACDDRPERATCFPAWDVGRYYRWGGIPSEFVREVYHRPERRRVRDEVRRLAREYNAHGDLADGDVFNRQARNSARWLWW
jgi:hypothetical protein